jgi:hypothetical protein
LLEATKNKSILKGARTIYWAVGTIFVACIVAGLLAVNIAANEANKHAGLTENRLVQAELMHLSERAIREQAEISYWDDAMHNLVLGPKPSKGFARENFSDWLIPDMGFSEFVLIGEDDQVKMVAKLEEVITSSPTSELAIFADDLVQLARQRFKDRRYKIGSKYLVEPEDGNVVPDITAFAFRKWQGVPSILVAQVMIAENRSYAAGEGEETVLLSVKPLALTLLSKSVSKLGIEGVFIEQTRNDHGLSGSVQMPDMASPPSLTFRWTPSEPRGAILSAALPIGTAITLVLTLILIIILRHNAGVLNDLSRSEETNRFLATHDKLTGLANREKFETALDRAFGVGRYSNFAIMFIDLDKFKKANDVYGHHAGDAVLKTVADRLNERIGDRGLVALSQQRLMKKNCAGLQMK